MHAVASRARSASAPITVPAPESLEIQKRIEPASSWDLTARIVPGESIRITGQGSTGEYVHYFTSPEVERAWSLFCGVPYGGLSAESRPRIIAKAVKAGLSDTQKAAVRDLLKPLHEKAIARGRVKGPWSTVTVATAVERCCKPGTFKPANILRQLQDLWTMSVEHEEILAPIDRLFNIGDFAWCEDYAREYPECVFRARIMSVSPYHVVMFDIEGKFTELEIDEFARRNSRIEQVD